MSSEIAIGPAMLTEPVLPPFTSTPVAPSAASSIVMRPPVSSLKSWLLFTVSATPLFTAIEPALEMRMLSAPEPVAFEVVIGVVREVEVTASAMAPDAAIRGAVATARASRIRIRKKPLWSTRAETPAILLQGPCQPASSFSNLRRMQGREPDHAEWASVAVDRDAIMMISYSYRFWREP